MLYYTLDGLILVGLLQTFSNDELELQVASIFSVFVSILAFGLSTFMLGVMGPGGEYWGAALTALVTGFLLSAIWGLEIKRATLIAVFLMAFHVGLTLFLNRHA
jgi:hypothetical protein